MSSARNSLTFRETSDRPLEKRRCCKEWIVSVDLDIGSGLAFVCDGLVERIKGYLPDPTPDSDATGFVANMPLVGLLVGREANVSRRRVAGVRAHL